MLQLNFRAARFKDSGERPIQKEEPNHWGSVVSVDAVGSNSSVVAAAFGSLRRPTVAKAPD
ncbi:hypothetical protein GCU67_20380 [Modestobacter muralis]|uniref:Uncharacterized protein n=1 Tax=Modestobacter muralis TaxID=1608614 RepID=A0A6P0EZA9_9ACTN|nr:hypothetical protein [Modestobacter muralis]NEK96507.1 hypothetical protein [Modestobacter muralis]NEN53407.1 hypothetical protein [Modestobacter muralis]